MPARTSQVCRAAGSEQRSRYHHALMIRGAGMSVATVDAQGRIALKPIAIGRNYGVNVEVLEGVTTEDQLVLNPSDSLNDGDQVVVAPPAKTAPAKAAKAAQ